MHSRAVVITRHLLHNSNSAIPSQTASDKSEIQKEKDITCSRVGPICFSFSIKRDHVQFFFLDILTRFIASTSIIILNYFFI